MKNNEARKQQEAQALQSEWKHGAARQGQCLSDITLKLPALLNTC